jgi:hypothetical protein
MPFRYSKHVTLAGLRRILSWSFLGAIGAGGAVFTIAFLGEGLAQNAIRQGRPEPDLTLAVIATMTVFYVAAIAFLAASCWGAWMLWRGRGIALVAGVALAGGLAGFMDKPLLAAAIGLGGVGYLYFSLGRRMPRNCSQCGEKVPVQAVICPQCGKDLPAPSGPEPATPE